MVRVEMVSPVPHNLSMAVAQVLGGVRGVVGARGRPDGLTNHPEGDVDKGLLMRAGLLLLFVVCCRRRLAGRSFWTNRAQAPGQLVLSPTGPPAAELSLGALKANRRVLSIPPGPRARFALFFHTQLVCLSNSVQGWFG